MVAIGVDIGSTCAKVIALEGDEIVFKMLVPTGWSSVDTAQSIRAALLEKGMDPERNPCVATGYGRVAVPYADKTITEITCHARGAMHLFGGQPCVVIDIGGQDIKVIHIAGGQVRNFLMNDKCSAGTGRFLEIMANQLALSPDDLCALASEGSGTVISSMCTVFAESEVISLIGRGETKANIAFAVVDSIAKKVAAQYGKARSQDRVYLTGGFCGSSYMRKALEREIKQPVQSHPMAHYAGAIGAAISAKGVKI